MASNSFFRIRADLKKPTQKQIELVRARALQKVHHSHKGESLDAKSIEALLRIVSGRYNELHRALESEYRRVDNRLDMKFAQGVRIATSLHVKIEHDITQLKRISGGKDHSGINYDNLNRRLIDLKKRKAK